MFFDGWNLDEWNSFYNFMIECFQFYLRNGLVNYEYVNLNKKTLVDETCSEFLEFADGFETEKIYDKKELYEKFINEYEEYKQGAILKLTQGKFTRWIKIWGQINNYNVIEKKSGKQRSILFEEKKKKNAA